MSICDSKMESALEALQFWMVSNCAKPTEILIMGTKAFLKEPIVSNTANHNEIKLALQQIGMEHGLGYNWLSDELVIDDKLMRDLNVSIGDLKHQDIDMPLLHVDVVLMESLLNLAVYRIDSLYCAKNQMDVDLVKDALDLADQLHLDIEQIKLATQKLVVCPDIYRLMLDVGGNRNG